jgi:hypothetical protein
MRPNFALGPIDSVTQYLLYLSIVVLGVLLPLLLNKWRTRREQRALLERTLKAMNAEIAANRKRVLSSHETLVRLREQLEVYRRHRLALSKRLRNADEPLPVAPPDDASWDVNVPLVTRTAWDVARLADALALLPEERLNAYTRVFHIQEVFERDRTALLAVLMQLELLELPADIARPESVDAQLQTLTVALATVRYHVGLAEGMIAAYDAALPANGPVAAP